MKQGYDALTEKEKETLRLLLAGHDAKSMARHLGLSVHTINERLRDARRKLSATSSREAARLLREAEGPETVGDNGIGDAEATPLLQDAASTPAAPNHRGAWAIGGLAMIAFAIAALALSAAPQAAQETARIPAAQNGSTSAPAPAETAVTEAARSWLALVDGEKWQESFAGTTRSFQTNNTFKMWQSASVGGRVPLGRVLSRRLVSEESVPAAPAGHQLVRFRTDFATKPGATETLSLAREGDKWRIVGYFIE